MFVLLFCELYFALEITVIESPASFAGYKKRENTEAISFALFSLVSYVSLASLLELLHCDLAQVSRGGPICVYSHFFTISMIPQKPRKKA